MSSLFCKIPRCACLRTDFPPRLYGCRGGGRRRLAAQRPRVTGLSAWFPREKWGCGRLSAPKSNPGEPWSGLPVFHLCKINCSKPWTKSADIACGTNAETQRIRSSSDQRQFSRLHLLAISNAQPIQIYAAGQLAALVVAAVPAEGVGAVRADYIAQYSWRKKSPLDRLSSEDLMHGLVSPGLSYRCISALITPQPSASMLVFTSELGV